MKRILAILTLVLCLQSAANAEIKFGLRGGVNLVDIDLKNITGTFSDANRAGFYVGPTVKFTIPLVGLGCDLSAIYDERTAWVDEQSTTYKSFTVPLNLRYSIGLGSMANFFLFAGPQFSFNIAHDKTIFDKDTYSEWTWQSSSLSVNAGLGFTLLRHIEVRGNYNIAIGKTGEAKFYDTIEKTVEKSFDSHYNAWQIGLAYYF